MPRVLIVDDEPDILLMLRIGLEAVGFETGLAADGDVALERIRKETFDIVVLDVMMPVLDGWAVLEALNGDPDAPPVVVLTAHPSPQGVEKAKALGASRYLTKPFPMEGLVGQLREVLEERVP